MDFAKVLAELRQELANLDAAINTLERLQRSGPPRRGRPPKSMAAPPRMDHEETSVPVEAVKKARRLP
jgi:hypothetical protein